MASSVVSSSDTPRTKDLKNLRKKRLAYFNSQSGNGNCHPVKNACAQSRNIKLTSKRSSVDNGGEADDRMLSGDDRDSKLISHSANRSLNTSYFEDVSHSERPSHGSSKLIIKSTNAACKSGDSVNGINKNTANIISHSRNDNTSHVTSEEKLEKDNSHEIKRTTYGAASQDSQCKIDLHNGIVVNEVHSLQNGIPPHTGYDSHNDATFRTVKDSHTLTDSHTSQNLNCAGLVVDAQNTNSSYLFDSLEAAGLSHGKNLRDSSISMKTSPYRSRDEKEDRFRGRLQTVDLPNPDLSDVISSCVDSPSDLNLQNHQLNYLDASMDSVGQRSSSILGQRSPSILGQRSSSILGQESSSILGQTSLNNVGKAPGFKSSNSPVKYSYAKQDNNGVEFSYQTSVDGSCDDLFHCSDGDRLTVIDAVNGPNPNNPAIYNPANGAIIKVHDPFSVVTSIIVHDSYSAAKHDKDSSIILANNCDILNEDLKTFGKHMSQNKFEDITLAKNFRDSKVAKSDRESDGKEFVIYPSLKSARQRRAESVLGNLLKNDALPNLSHSKSFDVSGKRSKDSPNEDQVVSSDRKESGRSSSVMSSTSLSLRQNSPALEAALGKVRMARLFQNLEIIEDEKFGCDKAFDEIESWSDREDQSHADQSGNKHTTNLGYQGNGKAKIRLNKSRQNDKNPTSLNQHNTNETSKTDQHDDKVVRVSGKSDNNAWKELNYMNILNSCDGSLNHCNPLSIFSQRSVSRSNRSEGVSESLQLQTHRPSSRDQDIPDVAQSNQSSVERIGNTVRCAFKADDIYAEANRRHANFSPSASSSELGMFSSSKDARGFLDENPEQVVTIKRYNDVNSNNIVRSNPKVELCLNSIENISNDFDRLLYENEFEEQLHGELRKQREECDEISSNRSEFQKKLIQLKEDLIESIMNNDDSLFARVTSGIKEAEQEIETFRSSLPSSTREKCSSKTNNGLFYDEMSANESLKYNSRLSSEGDSSINHAYKNVGIDKASVTNKADRTAAAWLSEDQNSNNDDKTPIQAPKSSRSDRIHEDCDSDIQLALELKDKNWNKQMQSRDSRKNHEFKFKTKDFKRNSAICTDSCEKIIDEIFDTSRNSSRQKTTVDPKDKFLFSNESKKQDDFAWRQSSTATSKIHKISERRTSDGNDLYHDNIDDILCSDDNKGNSGPEASAFSDIINNSNMHHYDNHNYDEDNHSYRREANGSMPAYLRDALSIVITDSVDISAARKNREHGGSGEGKTHESLCFNYNDAPWRKVNELVPENIRADLHLDLRASSDILSPRVEVTVEQDNKSCVLEPCEEQDGTHMLKVLGPTGDGLKKSGKGFGEVVINIDADRKLDSASGVLKFGEDRKKLGRGGGVETSRSNNGEGKEASFRSRSRPSFTTRSVNSKVKSSKVTLNSGLSKTRTDNDSPASGGQCSKVVSADAESVIKCNKEELGDRCDQNQILMSKNKQNFKNREQELMLPAPKKCIGRPVSAVSGKISRENGSTDKMTGRGVKSGGGKGSIPQAWGEKNQCGEGESGQNSGVEKPPIRASSAVRSRARPWSAKRSAATVPTIWKSAAHDWRRESQEAVLCSSVGGTNSLPRQRPLNGSQHNIKCLPLSPEADQDYRRLVEMTPRVTAGEVSMLVCFPDEILLRIFSSGLSHRDLAKCAATCRRFNALALDSSLWRQITLRCRCLTDAHLSAIGRRQPVTLSLIECTGENVTAAGLRELFRQCAATLQDLSFRGCRGGTLTGDDILLHSFSRCQKVTSVDARWTNVNDSGLNSLADSSHRLKKLLLEGCQNVTDSSLHNIIRKQGASLVSLDVSVLNCVSHETTQLISTHCSHLTHLRLSHCWKLTDSCLAEMSSGLKSLQSLDVSGCKQIRYHAVTQIVRKCPQLHTLNLSHCSLITDSSLVEIARCSSLRSLDVSHCAKVSNVGLKALLTGCKLLQYLDLSSTSVNNRGISATLKSECIERLETLKLNHCRQITLDTLRSLVVACTRLRHLSLYGNTALLLSRSELTSLSDRLIVEM